MRVRRTAKTNEVIYGNVRPVPFFSSFLVVFSDCADCADCADCVMRVRCGAQLTRGCASDNPSSNEMGFIFLAGVKCFCVYDVDVCARLLVIVPIEKVSEKCDGRRGSVETTRGTYFRKFCCLALARSFDSKLNNVLLYECNIWVSGYWRDICWTIQR